MVLTPLLKTSEKPQWKYLSQSKNQTNSVAFNTSFQLAKIIQGKETKNMALPLINFSLPAGKCEESHGCQKAMNRANLRGLSRKELLIQLLENGTDWTPIVIKSLYVLKRVVFLKKPRIWILKVYELKTTLFCQPYMEKWELCSSQEGMFANAYFRCGQVVV